MLSGFQMFTFVQFRHRSQNEDSVPQFQPQQRNFDEVDEEDGKILFSKFLLSFCYQRGVGDVNKSGIVKGNEGLLITWRDH